MENKKSYWEEWGENVGATLMDGIRDTDPYTNPDEWLFYWDMLAVWRTNMEAKSRQKARKQIEAQIDDIAT